jgi:hypothetical protein
MTLPVPSPGLVGMGLLTLLAPGCTGSSNGASSSGGGVGARSGGEGATGGTGRGAAGGSDEMPAGGVAGSVGGVGAMGNGGGAGGAPTGGVGGSIGAPAEPCETLSSALPARAGGTLVVSPGPGTSVTLDGTQMSLRAAISSAEPGDTVLLEPGAYTFDEAASGAYTGVYVTEPDVTIRGSTGDPHDVVVDSAYADHGDQTAPFSIAASGVVLADLTVRRSIFHLVHLWEGADDVVLHGLRLVDGGQQFVKASPGSGANDAVQVSCSSFEMTATGRDNVWGYGPADGSTTCYTGGIDAHDATNWRVLYNRFEGIYCDASGVARPAHGKKAADRGGSTYHGGLAEHAIHMWNSSEGTAHHLEGNTIVDCARGIGLGLVDDVHGGVISNNMVTSQHPASGEHDVGIIVERGHGVTVENNTVFFGDPAGYPNAVEIRWGATDDVVVRNTLANRAITSRDGASPILAANVTDATGALFVDARAGDLHLASCSDSSIVGAGEVSATTTSDIDGEPRDGATDIGADQCAR